MDIWETLGIEPTTDIKIIKRAYAKKLKVTRPDEQAEAFQDLYASYKHSLAYAKANAKTAANEQQQQDQQTSNDTLASDEGPTSAKLAEGSRAAELAHSNANAQATPPTNSKHARRTSDKINEQSNVAESAQQHPQEPSEEDKRAIANYEAQYAALAKQCELTIENEGSRNNISAWAFLMHSPMLLDSQVNTKLGLLLFESIFTIHNSFKNLSKHQRKYSGPNLLMQKTTLVYLNDIFSWHTQVNLLQHYIGSEACQLLIPKIYEAIEQNSNNQAPPKVKGGTGFKFQKPVDVGAKQDERTYAHFNLLALNNWATGALCVVLAIFVWIGLNQGDVYIVVLSIAAVAAVSFQWWALKQEKIVAYYTMWGFSSLLLLWFPIGTIFGFRLLIALYKSRGFIK